MPSLAYDSALPPSASTGSFLQTLRLIDGKRTLGVARWHVDDARDGVVQLLELSIDPANRRCGHGRSLFEAVLAQAAEFHRARRIPLRRIWINLRQKDQILARSFLTARGFHHVGSIENLFEGQTGLIYMRSFD